MSVCVCVSGTWASVTTSECVRLMLELTTSQRAESGKKDAFIDFLSVSIQPINAHIFFTFLLSCFASHKNKTKYLWPKCSLYTTLLRVFLFWTNLIFFKHLSLYLFVFSSTAHCLLLSFWHHWHNNWNHLNRKIGLKNINNSNLLSCYCGCSLLYRIYMYVVVCFPLHFKSVSQLYAFANFIVIFIHP